MKIFAVIDTNIIVSALIKINSQTNPRRVLDAVAKGQVVPVLHNDIIKEYGDVLLRKKFGFPKEIVQQVVQNIKQSGEFVFQLHYDKPFIDEKDRIFFEVLLMARQYTDAYLITGNIKHFLKMPFVLTPGEFLSILAAG